MKFSPRSSHNLTCKWCRFREGTGPIQFNIQHFSCDIEQQSATVEWKAVFEAREQDIVGVSVLQFEEEKIAETRVYRQLQAT
jgi:hypothetical protein